MRIAVTASFSVSLALAAVAAEISLPSIVSDEVLEPSVINEVDHALAIANGGALAKPAEFPADWTNGLSRTRQAIRLVSLQRADGKWFDGTNEVTAAVVRRLEELRK